MPATFDCPCCNRPISADVPPGTQVQCPLCSQIVTVPPEAAPPVREVAASYINTPVYGPPVGQGWAIAALVCGICGVVVFPPIGVAGVVVGIMALDRIKRDPHKHGGRGMAVAGICVGSVGIAMMVLLVSIMFPLLSGTLQDYEETTHREQCAENLTLIVNAMYFYAQDGGMFPEDLEELVSQGGKITSAAFTCPADVEGSQSYYYVPGYGLSSDLDQIILYEDPLIHADGGGHIVTVDTTVRFVDSPEFEELIDAIKLPDGTPFAPHEE